ncbi:tyrosine-type recombinase/integrase [Algoriphagus aquatilis]|uniref:Tyrosine-type recombinase/integrase n=1 Tax=Algoriphagus aquatilis TaxID=490186 RepID=A0ABW0BW55_9BACT
MAKFNFNLRQKNTAKETPIVLIIRYNGDVIKYPTGKAIQPKFWNSSEQLARLVKDFPEAKVFNENLKYIKASAEKAFLQLEVELGRAPFSKELTTRINTELKRDLNPSITPEEEKRPPSFIELFKAFIHDSESGLRLTASGKKFDKRSIQKYNTVYENLKDFGKKYHLTFESIDKNFYSKYVASLNKKNFTLNNVGKYIQVIKTFLTYATENGYNTNLFFQSKQFKAHKVPGFSIYLTKEEITAIYKKDFSQSSHLERVRDLFVVGCWTGLRFSDFTAIKPENIKGELLEIKMFKGKKKVMIPLHWMVKEIMAKYSGKYPNSLPPAISNQKMNDYLKDIAGAVDCLKVPVEVDLIKGGLETLTEKEKWELVTTHTARRSFATNVYKSGFPAVSLMKITGHRTEKAFLLYIKVTPEENAIQLLEHWNKINLQLD